MGRLLLEGNHVRLEPLTLDHIPALVSASSADRSTYGWTWVPHGEAAMSEYVRKAIEREAAGTTVPFATVRREDGMVVGSTRFTDIERYGWPEGSELRRDVDAVEIGYTWLHPAAQRTPINTEAKYLMLRHAFEVWRVHRVTLMTDERNERSRRAIERIGARFEGLLRANRMAYDGGLRDTALYSMLPAEWPAAKAALEARLSGA